MNFALNDLSPTAKKLILAPEGEFSDAQNILHVKHNFDVNDVLTLIGNVKYIGVVSSEKFDGIR